MQKTITVTAKEQPAFLKAMLESLVRNTLDDWTIYVSIEPGPAAADIVDISRSILANQHHEIAVNDAVLGLWAHPHHVFSRAFSLGSELNLHLEEDLLVSPDATALASWYIEHHKPGWLCLNLLAGPCGSAATLSDPRFPGQTFLAHTFNSLGFAMRRQEWHDLIEPVWFGGSVPQVAGGSSANWRTQGVGGWDWAIYGLLASRQDLVSVQPILARAIPTGRRGACATPQFHDQTFEGLVICEEAVGAFQLVEIDKLAREVRSLIYAHEELTELRLQLEKRARVAGAAVARLTGQRFADRHRGAKRAHRLWNSAKPSAEHGHYSCLVSVIMSVRNGVTHLDTAVRSILEQTETAFTLIIIDDGSSDSSMNVARSFRDPRVKIIQDDLHLGLAERLNQVLDDVSTPFAARMDADDIAVPQRLERQLAFMQQHPEVGICGTWYMPFDYRGVSRVRVPTKHFEIAARTLWSCPLSHPTVMFNMANLNKHGLRYAKEAVHAEDYDLWERAHPLVRIANIPEYLLYYRLHPSQVCSNYIELQRLVADRIRARALRRFGILAEDDELALHCAYSWGDDIDGDGRRERLIEWLQHIRRLKRGWNAADRAVRNECCIREAALRARSR